MNPRRKRYRPIDPDRLGDLVKLMNYFSQVPSDRLTRHGLTDAEGRPIGLNGNPLPVQ